MSARVVRSIFSRAAGCAGLLGCLAWCAHAAAGLADCVDATCRITAPDGSRGTGCVFEISQGLVYVLTAGHVVGDSPAVDCEFWHDGHQSQPLAGRVVARADARSGDAAIVALPEAPFAGVLPTAIPVAPADRRLQPGEPITSVGCANGAWSTGWKGHVLGYDDDDVQFVPPPAQGRSGSALFDAEGKQIVGLVRARTMDDRVGIACSVQSLYRDLGRAVAEHATQCGPNGCPVPQYRVLPYRQNQEMQQYRSANPYPTLPTPPVDLSPLGAKLDTLADLVRGLRQAPASPTAPGAADRQTRDTLAQYGQALEAHGKQIQALQDGIPKIVANAVQPVAEQVDNIAKVVRPLSTVHDRLEALEQQGGLRGRIAGKILQDVEDPTAWVQNLLKFTGVAGVAVFGVLLLVMIHRHAQQTGKPDPLEKVVDDLKLRLQGAAATNPSLAPVAAGATALDDAMQRLHTRLDGIQTQIAQTQAAAQQTQAVAQQTPAKAAA